MLCVLHQTARTHNHLDQNDCHTSFLLYILLAIKWKVASNIVFAVFVSLMTFKCSRLENKSSWQSDPENFNTLKKMLTLMYIWCIVLFFAKKSNVNQLVTKYKFKHGVSPRSDLRSTPWPSSLYRGLLLLLLLTWPSVVSGDQKRPPWPCSG